MGYSKFVQSGNFIEFYDYEKNVSSKVHVKRERSGRKTVRKVGRSVIYRSGYVKRQRQCLIRIVRSNLEAERGPFLVTCTMDDIVPISIAYKEWYEFVKRLRRVYGKEFKYVCVPEFQKRGAVHFHVLIWGLDDVLKNERSSRKIQNLWSYGFVDCMATDGDVRLAGYIAKYMSKSLYDVRLCGQKGFVCSRNVLRPVSVASEISVEVREMLGVDKSNLLYEKFFDTMWLGKGRYQIYNIKKKC